MICKVCGSKVEQDSMFCTTCGATMKVRHGSKTRKEAIKAGQLNNSGRPKVPPITLTSKLVTAFVLVVVFLLVLLVSTTIVNNKFSAEKIAETYFVKLVNGDYKSAYKFLDLENDDFVNKETFETYAKQMNYEKITEYLVEDADNSGSSGGAVSILYFQEGQSEQSRFYVDMSLAESKKLLFFDDWKVSSGSAICTNTEFEVHNGASLVIDGIEIAPSYLVQDKYGESSYDSYYDVYRIPQMFRGYHTIEVSVEGMTPVKETLFLDSSDMSYEYTSLYCTEEMTKEIQTLAINNMYRIYDAAVKGLPFDEIASLFVNESEILSYVAEEYSYLVQNMQESIRVDKISFSNIVSYGDTSSAYVEVSFDYVIEGMIQDWWSGEWVQDTYQSSQDGYFEFVNENGQWKQTVLGCGNLY